MNWKRVSFGLAAAIMAAFLAQVAWIHRSVEMHAVSIPLEAPVNGAAWVTARVYCSRGDGVSRPAVILCHGYAACKETLTAYAVELARSGMEVIAFDFPGHGQSPGACAVEQDHAAIVASVHAWLIRQPGVDAARIGMLGHSFGGFVTAEYLRRVPASAVRGAVLMGASFSEDDFWRAGRGNVPWKANTLILLGRYEYILPPSVVRENAGKFLGADAARQMESREIGYRTPAGGGLLRLAVSPYSEHCLEAWDGMLLREAAAWFAREFQLSPPAPSRWIRLRYLWLPLAAFTTAWLAWISFAARAVKHREGVWMDWALALGILAGYFILVRAVFFPWLYACPVMGRWWLHGSMGLGMACWQWAKAPLLEKSWRNRLYAHRPWLLFLCKAMSDGVLNNAPMIAVVFWMMSCGFSVTIGDIAVRGMALSALSVAGAAIRVMTGRPRVEWIVVSLATGWALPVLGGLR